MFVTSQLRTDENESLMLLRSLLEPKTMDDVIDAGGSIIWQNHVQRWLTEAKHEGRATVVLFGRI